MNSIDKLGFYDDSGTLLLDLKLTDEGEWNLYAPVALRSDKRDRKTWRLEFVRFGADAEALRDAMVELETVLEDATEQIDSPFAGWTWLHWQTDGESDKRALVFGGLVDVVASDTSSANVLNSSINAQVELQLGPWETVAMYEPTAENVSNQGGTIDLTGVGTLPARVQRVKLEWDSVTTNHVSQLWVGIREKGQGLSSFDPNWPLSGSATTLTSTYATIDSTGVADVISSDYEHMVGTYRLLLEYSVTDGKQIALSGGIGLRGIFGSGASNVVWNNEVYVTGDGLTHFIDLGQISLPFTGNKMDLGPTGIIPRQSCAVQAMTRDSGTVQLTCKRFVLMPARHLLLSSDDLGDTGHEVNCYHFPDGKNASMRYASTDYSPVAVSLFDFEVPRKDSKLVIAFDNVGGVADSYQVDVSLEIARRWRSYREDS